MKFLVPIDSRLSNAQGFAVIDMNGDRTCLTETEETLPYARKGFRGACMVGTRLCVCTSFSLKFYDVKKRADNSYTFHLCQQIHRPEWLIGRGANADLHIPYYNEEKNQILVANSYMDCIDIFSPEGIFIDRNFLWEISPEIDKLARRRNPNAADLCHINFFSQIGGQPVATLCNLNGTDKGAVLSLETGELWLPELARPHDGIWRDETFYITETHSNRLLIYPGITHPSDLANSKPVSVEIGAGNAWKSDKGIFWLRGLHVTEDMIYLGCSQFQDRDTGQAGVVPSHIILIDRHTYSIVDRKIIPSDGRLKNPVIYNFLDVETAVSTSN